ncbi:MAG: bis(5'-nucleosyl)-tetraphosphatase (symmetrical) YqeK [Clostridiales bacterium]|nr:bis(5'-nucleosyl)-tetraphosphatase (symmetrical) YqeK [Clostridiales bacterium]
MRIALFGGSFDPVHYGHLELIRGAIASGSVDIVIVIPTVNNNFKRGRALTPAPYRYYMTDAVISSEFKKKVFVSDIEFSFDGITYTVNTLRQITKDSYIIPFLIKNGIPGERAAERHSFFWLCGSDILRDFDKWHKPAEVLSYAALLCAKREGDESDLLYNCSRLKELFGCDIALFNMKGIDQASSDIRNRNDISALPGACRDFIATHDLYNAIRSLDNCSDEACDLYYRSAVRMYPTLSSKRLLHTLNVGLLAAKLAHDHGIDADKALIAGALHDSAKEYPIEEQRSMAREISGDMFDHEKLLHSPAGAYIAMHDYGITDQEILDAITYHTTGRGGATTLDKIVYLADKIEPSRTYTDLTEMRRLAPVDLDEAVRLCAISVADKFRRKGRDLHPVTSDFMRELGIVL